MKRALATALVATSLLAPRLAEACPQCAANDKGGIAAGILIGAMIVLPFPLVALVVRIIKKHS